MTKTALISATLALLALTSGCGAGRHIQKGINCYRTSHHAGALAVFEEVGEREDRMNHKGLVRYLVYRGLAHYQLGHRRWAHHFLTRGREVHRRGKLRWLPPHAQREMTAALIDLGRGVADRSAVTIQ